MRDETTGSTLFVVKGRGSFGTRRCLSGLTLISLLAG